MLVENEAAALAVTAATDEETEATEAAGATEAAVEATAAEAGEQGAADAEVTVADTSERDVSPIEWGTGVAVAVDQEATAAHAAEHQATTAEEQEATASEVQAPVPSAVEQEAAASEVETVASEVQAPAAKAVEQEAAASEVQAPAAKAADQEAAASEVQATASEATEHGATDADGADDALAAFFNDGQSSILIVTGAGLSVASGIATFRAKDGVWDKNLMSWGTRDAFCHWDAGLNALQSAIEWWNRFWLPTHGLMDNNGRTVAYNNDLEKWITSQPLPNPGHHAISSLITHTKGRASIITQNIDGLHGESLGEELREKALAEVAI